MPTQNIIDSGQCSVVTNNTYNTTGSLTRSVLKAATPTEALAWYYNSAGSGTYNPMSAYIAHQLEMSMCGIQREGFYDWIMSGLKDRSALWRPQSVGRGPSIIQPFILAMQESVLNDEDWSITGGWKTASGSPFNTGTLYDVTPSTGTGPITALTGGDRVIRVTPKYTLTADAQYFIPQYKVVIQSLSSSGTTQTSVYRIVDAAHEAATPPTYVDVLLKAETDNNASAWFNAAPGSGVVRLLPPNIMDVEAFCKNRINVNTKKQVPFWVQTIRKARKVSSEYTKVRSQLLRDNAWFAKFVDLDDAERNRQDEIKYRRELVNALLFQEPISSNQTLANWASLTHVTSINSGITVDPGTGGQLIGYKANMVGLLPQLRACGQALDYQNAALNIKTWVESYIYNIYRARKSGGKANAESIDVYTDSDTAAQAEVAFIDWYADRFGATNQIQIDAYKTQGNNEFGFSWRSFKVPTKPAGVTINFITSMAFDDLKNALGSTYEQAGRYLWTCDFNGSIYPAIVASNRKVHTVGELNDLSRIDSTFACVMENPTETVTMTSETLTFIVECPLRSRVDYGFSQINYTP